MSTQFSAAKPGAFAAERDARAEAPLKAVVVGGSGQIGGWLLRHLAARGHQGVGTYSSQAFPGLVPLDAADRDAVTALLTAEKPDVVFYPAGFTWVDGCERDAAKAYAANLEQPLHVGPRAVRRRPPTAPHEGDEQQTEPYDPVSPRLPSTRHPSDRTAPRACGQTLVTDETGIMPTGS